MVQFGAAWRGGFIAILLLAGCKDRNEYKPPPPAEVSVARPVARVVTPTQEFTGAVQAFSSVDLVARVPGFLQYIAYKDGEQVAQGALLFLIERAPYQASVDAAQAALAAQQALLVQAQADYARTAELAQRQVSSVSNLDDARAKRDSTSAAVNQAKAQLDQAQINLAYTEIRAPFAGVVTAHLAETGALVGAGGATRLATILALNPIHVSFEMDERLVQRLRTQIRSHGLTVADLQSIPVDVGLQTESGFPHTGHIDYIAPQIDAGTGTLSVRAVLDNPEATLLPGMFVRVRLPADRPGPALLVPDTALGTDQQGRTLLVVDDKGVVAVRPVQIGGLEPDGLRVIRSGIGADDQVVVAGRQRAIPGNVVHATAQAASGR